MRDPFPFAAPQFLQDAITPFAQKTGLTILPIHIHEVILSITLYTVIGTHVSPWLSNRLCPDIYRKLDKRTKTNWDVHVVSMFQSVLICAMAFYSIFCDEARPTMTWRERLWGYTGYDGFMASMACGYFLWDLVISAINVRVFGYGMLAHAISAAVVFSFGYRPFVNYYAATFLLYELSSPFNNIHWFLDKVKLTGSTYQWVNGIVLIVTFFSCRLVWGTYNSVWVFYDMYKAFQSGSVTTDYSQYPDAVAQRLSGILADEKDLFRFTAGRPLPLWLLTVYLSANIVLNSLNIYWMGKMVETIRKRFDPPWGTKGVVKSKETKSEPGGVKKEPIPVPGIDHKEVKKTFEQDGVRSRRRG